MKNGILILIIVVMIVSCTSIKQPTYSTTSLIESIDSADTYQYGK